MAEKELTKILTKAIKDADKLVQDIEKGTKNIMGVILDLKKLGEGKGEGKKEDESDK